VKRGTNTTIINWTAEMQTLLLERVPSDSYLANSLQVFFLEYFKNNFIEKFGAEEYERQLAKASRTMVQIKNDNLKEKQEKIQKQEEKLNVQKRRLEERRAEEMRKEDEKFLKENDAERERELEKIREKLLRDAKKERTDEQLENLKEALSEG
jgi:FKBP-type peptidyl-prolyl cis-trans isomerase